MTGHHFYDWFRHDGYVFMYVAYSFPDTGCVKLMTRWSSPIRHRSSYLVFAVHDNVMTFSRRFRSCGRPWPHHSLLQSIVAINGGVEFDTFYMYFEAVTSAASFYSNYERVCRVSLSHVVRLSRYLRRLFSICCCTNQPCCDTIPSISRWFRNIVRRYLVVRAMVST